ncbi:sigma-70 family RNA polymerase sigma factor [Kitasatospora sp. NPDC056327]|uniref:sigma-70 family RNA polymerase sigma factor n=1 Tax=Kitasatospora sp. NPDC056327 TaxID=3345785 RepID=UPI0035E25936
MTSPSPTRNDAHTTGLALAARDGDADAADHLVRALHRDVWRFVAHLTHDPQAADDLTQETFLRALGALGRYQGRASARNWLLAIARRAVVDHYRRSTTRPRVSAGTAWEQAAERAQPAGLPGFDDGVALRHLLDGLPEERRTAFVLTQLVGLPYADAAHLSGCPVGTVRSRVARARTTLRRGLEA